MRIASGVRLPVGVHDAHTAGSKGADGADRCFSISCSFNNDISPSKDLLLASRCPNARGITWITRNRRTRKNASQRRRVRMIVVVGLFILSFFLVQIFCNLALLDFEYHALFHQQFRGSKCVNAGHTRGVNRIAILCIHERLTQ